MAHHHLEAHEHHAAGRAEPSSAFSYALDGDGNLKHVAVEGRPARMTRIGSAEVEVVLGSGRYRLTARMTPDGPALDIEPDDPPVDPRT